MVDWGLVECPDLFPSTKDNIWKKYPISNNDILPFFACFQLKSQINK